MSINFKKQNFQHYLVGGAVRDNLLGIAIKDKDWVVVGETIDNMLALGFTAVGKTFPVFLHPDTKEEYALARKEVKVGAGYTGFECIADPTITLEEDLLRRDLTINAIAKNSQGDIIDPYNGVSDIQQKVLRHVSDAFIEDPLRVLRVARFHARFYSLGFKVARETMQLMTNICASKELNALTPERVWQETEKALLTANPEQYFLTLKECGALQVIFPEVYALFGIDQRAEYHPEIDCGIHTLLCLEQATQLSEHCTDSEKISIRFSALVHDLGKAITPTSILPSHRGHEHKGIPLVKALCARLKTPKQVSTLAPLCCEFHLQCHTAFELKPSTILKLFKRIDAFRQPTRLVHFLICCKADARGRTGFENNPYEQARYLTACFDSCKNLSVKDLQSPSDIQGKAIGEAIDRLKTAAIKAVKQEYISP